ncbi:hypothetical protein TWF788_008259 [Orbilia oligospora]|uniref:F-box domain-containing protein n=1 Tax=Orbilia oligospora TaxID=2813651 RepID=A0A7C8U1B8_ORBOL|nr:hypothetical protein TWF788_008259 [Orbilia oligospora]
MPLLDLPREILFLIFKSISSVDITNLMLTSKVCYGLSRSLLSPLKALAEYQKAYKRRELVMHDDSEASMSVGNYTGKGYEISSSLSSRTSYLSNLLKRSSLSDLPSSRPQALVDLFIETASQTPLLHIHHTKDPFIGISTIYTDFGAFKSLKYLRVSVSAAGFEEEDFLVLKGAIMSHTLEGIAFLLHDRISQDVFERLCLILENLSFSPRLKAFELIGPEISPNTEPVRAPTLYLPYEWRGDLERCRSIEISTHERGKLCYSDEQGPRGNFEAASPHFQSLADKISTVLDGSSTYRNFLINLWTEREIYGHGTACNCTEGFSLTAFTHHYINSDRDDLYYYKSYFHASRWTVDAVSGRLNTGLTL